METTETPALKTLSQAWLAHLPAPSASLTAQLLEAFAVETGNRQNDATLHNDYATVLFSLGRLKDAFAQVAKYYRCSTHPVPVFPSDCPLWDGRRLAGRTVQVYLPGEVAAPGHGYGDHLQFSRSLHWLTPRGADLQVVAPRALHTLFRRSFGVECWDSAQRPWPDAHALAPYTWLPFVLDRVNAPLPYLVAPPDIPTVLCLPNTGRRRVGICWHSALYHPYADLRSCQVEAFRPLLAVPGIEWYSLQVGPSTAELASMRLDSITDLTMHLHTFDDTAALIEQLDLVITVDTAVAHLAGALGRPTWLLLSQPANWRWLIEGHSSPWYPTMRLFRQRISGDWTSVIAEVADALGVKTRQS